MPGAGNHCQQSLKQLGCRRDGGPKTAIGLPIYFEMWWDQPGNRFSSRTRCSSCKRRCEKSSAAGSWCDISSFACYSWDCKQPDCLDLSGIAWYSHWIVAFALELGTQCIGYTSFECWVHSHRKDMTFQKRSQVCGMPIRLRMRKGFICSTFFEIFIRWSCHPHPATRAIGFRNLKHFWMLHCEVSRFLSTTVKAEKQRMVL